MKKLAFVAAAALAGSAWAQVSCQTIGSFTTCSDGSSSQQIGNFTIGNDGSSAQRIGNSTFFNPAPTPYTPPPAYVPIRPVQPIQPIAPLAPLSPSSPSCYVTTYGRYVCN